MEPVHRVEPSPPSPAYDVLTVGRTGVDIYPLQVGVGLEDVRTFGKFLGGTAANVAVAAARHGLRTALVTRTGDDPFGRFVHRALRELGVDDRFVTPVADLPTPVTFCEIFPPDDFPLYFYRRPAAPDMQLTAADLDPAAVRDARVFWTTGSALSEEPSRSAHHAAWAVRGRRRLTVLDLDYRPMFWPARARPPASSCPRRWSRSPSPSATSTSATPPSASATRTARRRRCWSAGSSWRWSSRARRGCWPAPGTSWSRCAPIPVDVVNGLGAGDAFGGALCRGLLAGWPLERVLRFANAAGAIVASRLECSTAMPSSDEVEAAIAAADLGATLVAAGLPGPAAGPERPAAAAAGSGADGAAVRA